MEVYLERRHDSREWQGLSLRQMHGVRYIWSRRFRMFTDVGPVNLNGSWFQE
jgi:hypothetical protein